MIEIFEFMDVVNSCVDIVKALEPEQDKLAEANKIKRENEQRDAAIDFADQFERCNSEVDEVIRCPNCF